MAVNAYNTSIETLVHADLSFNEASRILRDSMDASLEVRAVLWTDSEGFECQTFRIVDRTLEPKKFMLDLTQSAPLPTTAQGGMTLEEAKAFIVGQNSKFCFGRPYGELMQMQYK